MRMSNAPLFFAGLLLAVPLLTGCGPGEVVIGGGPSSEPVTLASGELQPQAIAVDTESLYWTNRTGPGLGGSVMKVGIDGGTPATLVSLPDTVPWGIAVDATSVYWTDQVTGTVMKVGIDG